MTAEHSKAVQNIPSSQETATFAGGCFWCMEAPFHKQAGVLDVVSGYAGGEVENPTYEEVSSGKTGHVEAVQVIYDPSRISFQALLEIYFRQVDPTDAKGQFADRGSQYKTAIFFHDEGQRKKAEQVKTTLEASGLFKRPIATRILPFSTFYPAEDYHQDYFQKNPDQYERYRIGSGREGFLQDVWGKQNPFSCSQNVFARTKPDQAALRAKLTSQQYEVTQNNATEPPFKNEYWNNHEEGIYVDIVSGQPLFASIHQFDSGSGWPSFTQPLTPERIVEKKDSQLGMTRIEVRSLDADSHLGHLFYDGPPPSQRRYCINSAALRFIPKHKLAEAGHANYLSLFE